MERKQIAPDGRGRWRARLAALREWTRGPGPDSEFADDFLPGDAKIPEFTERDYRRQARFVIAYYVFIAALALWAFLLR
jgi:hypothetical protein